MLELMQFIFSDWLHYMGTLIFLIVVIAGLNGVIRITINKDGSK